MWRYLTKSRWELLRLAMTSPSTKERHAAKAALVMMDSMDRRAKDAEEKWITVNGTHILVGEGGEIKAGPPKLKKAMNGENGGSTSKAEQIESLQKEISGLSRFGAAGKKRKELEEKLRQLQGPKPEAVQRKPSPSPAPRPPLQPESKEKEWPVTQHKQDQFEIIQKNNAMSDDFHVGIRKPSDIRSAEEALGTTAEDDGYSYPDFTRADGQRALKSGKITLYSSKPIREGGFVSPSKVMAGDYAGGGKVYSLTVPVDQVAWINADEGQFAPVKRGQNDADWNEGDHPRGERGRFRSNGGSSSSLTKGSGDATISSKARISRGLSKPRISLAEREMVRHELNTWIDKNPVRPGIISKAIRNHVYNVMIYDFNEYEILGKTPIRALSKRRKK